MPMTALGALAYLQGLVPALGWTLAHFLWQGALVAFALQVALKGCRSARARHDWALAALALMAILPVATFAWLQGGVEIVLVPKGFPGLTPVGQQWETFAVGTWLAGVTVLATRMAGGLLLVERLRRTAETLPSEWVLRCRMLEQRIVLPMKVAFARSEAVSTPIVAGWLKPMVLIPAGFLTRVPPAELEALILHELAHVRRLDAFANLIQSVVETLLFYHPAVWWVSRRVRLEREQCCDDLAVAAIRDPALYVRALQSLDALRTSPYGVLAATGEGDLKHRAARILGLAIAPERPALSRTAAVAILALGAVAMTHGAAVQAEPTPAPSTAVKATGAVPQAVTAGPDLAPVTEHAAPRVALAPAPRIVLAAADVATPVPLGQPLTPAADPPLATAAAPAAVGSPPAAKAQPVAYAPTVGPLVVSPIKPVKPDARIDGLELGGPLVWPKDALSEGFEGRVVLSCRVDVHGLAERCAVLSESPANKGFGAAALELRPSLKLKPAQGPDGPMESTMTVAINYRVPVFSAVGPSSGGVSCTGGGGAPPNGKGGSSGPPSCAGGGRSPGLETISGLVASLPVTMLDNPLWVRAVSFDELAAAYPAGGRGEEGYVVDHCAVRRDGVLEGCAVIQEVPAGRGFARAGLALSHRFRVAPQQASDPRGGRQLWVDLPIRFPSAKEMAERTVMAPRWVAGFDPGKALEVYPPEAAAAGVTSGRGVARCIVDAGGGLVGCVADEPDGYGFSAAAAKLASTLKMNLWSADGAPVEGGVVHIPIRLNLKGAAMPTPGN